MSKTSRLIPLAPSALGLLLASAAGAADPVSLPTLSVEGEQGANASYSVEKSTIGKLPDSLAETPQSATALSRQLLDDQAIVNSRDALRNVPGVSLAAGESGAQGDNLTIRGFTARNDLYLDGMRDFGSYYRDPFNTEQIEVLKGPSSTLFGRGSTGGIVETGSKHAELGDILGGSLTFGTNGTKRITADYNTPLPELGQGAALRLNVLGSQAGTAGRDVAESNRFGFAPSLALGLGTPTRITVSLMHQSDYDIPDYGLPWLYVAPTGAKTGLAVPAPVDHSNFYGFEHGDYLRTNDDIATTRVEHDFADNVTVSDQVRYANESRNYRITEPQIDNAATNGSSATARLYAPGTPLSSILVSRNQIYGDSAETMFDNQLDATVTFQTGSVSHKVTGGFEFIHETSDPNRNSTIGPYSTTSLLAPTYAQAYNAITYSSARTRTNADTEAGYLLDEVQLLPEWKAILGTRFDHFDANYSTQALANPVTHAGAAYTKLSHIDNLPSWRAALVWEPVPDGMIYFSYGTSFNPSAESLSLAASTVNLDPEKNQTYEIGEKWQFFAERLLVTTAVYHTEKTNMRETDPTNSNLQILAGDGVVKGAEFQLVGKLTEKWQIQAGYSYNLSEIEKSPQNDVGRPLANAPKHTASLWTTYTLPYQIEVGGGVNYLSDRWANTTARAVGGVNFWELAKGYWTASTMAKMPITEGVSVQLNVNNLFDRTYIDLIHPSHVVPGEGRSALFSLNAKF